MTPTVFASFKYQHTDPVTRSPGRLQFVVASLAVALLVIVWTGFVPGAALLVVPLVAWLSATRQLHLGPRYLLCGNSIVYYGNVKRLTLSRAQGKLNLVCANGESFVLDRTKFPTGARKAAKITKNKAAKFDKVSAKIIEKVRAASTHVNLIGV